MIYTINNCIRAFGYTNFDRLIADMGSVDNLKAYVIANGYADIAVAEDTELLLVDENGKETHTGCYGAKLNEYLCFTANRDSKVCIVQEGTPTDISKRKVIQYKINNGQWQTLDLSTVSLTAGDKMYLKSDDTIPMSESAEIYKKFKTSNGIIDVSGNIMSLLNFSTSLTPYCFYRLFNYANILRAQELELPATTLAPNCYRSMFQNCTNLSIGPSILPATELAEGCYQAMFSSCFMYGDAKKAPELPATTLAQNCYNYMFSGCSKLNYVKAMFTDISAEGCLNGWLYNVSSTGTLIKNKDATWSNTDAMIPSGWTVQTEV